MTIEEMRQQERSIERELVGRRAAIANFVLDNRIDEAIIEAKITLGAEASLHSVRANIARARLEAFKTK